MACTNGFMNMFLVMGMLNGNDPRFRGILFGPHHRMPYVLTGKTGPSPCTPAPCPIRAFVLRAAMAACLAGALVPIHAQDGSNLRLKWIQVSPTPVRIDSLSIIPGSLHIMACGLPVGDWQYDLDPYPAGLVWTEPPLCDSVLVRYRVLPLLFTHEHTHKDRERLLTTSGDREDPFKYVPPKEPGDLLGAPGLNRSGSISRGVLFGNNQDLSVNSTLNLELNGRITESIHVLASITDNNIPIQAGGNTLELQDFDQVFIKLYEPDTRIPGNRWELIAGDFVLQRPTSHFLTYLKKAKGLSFGTRFGPAAGDQHTVGFSAAISKGKFARNLVQGVEGVQGPYRLRGNDGEQFIIVLSGTERVFIDGQLLVRGQENDYVIDYNTAEVTFTARRMITKDRRIAVEFQYSDKNYARSLLRLDNTSTIGPNSKVRFNLYSEQDHRNQPLQQQLSDEEREVLRLAGDDPLAATVPGVDSIGYAADQVLYRQTDSLGYSPVYVYSTQPEEALYRVTFTQVGSGNGDYLQQEFTPNGRVFRWVSPDPVTGAKQGDHAPVRVLVAPRSQQVITLGMDHRFSLRTKATAEVAFSNNDRNTFSTLDAQDDQGVGVFVGGDHEVPLSPADTTIKLVFSGDVETLSRHFTFVERYRAVEFERNWNALGTPLIGDQVLAGIRTGLRGQRLGKVTLGMQGFRVGDSYEGWRPELNADLHVGRWDIKGAGSWLNTTLPRESDFLRHKARITRRSEHFTIGFQDEHERNRYWTTNEQGLSTGSYQFWDWEAFIQASDSARTKWRLGGGQRYEQALRIDQLAPSTRATAFTFNMDLSRDPRNRLATTFTYRQLEILDSTLTPQKPEDTYLARVEYNGTYWKGAALLNAFYEFGSGLEQRREYIYIEVPAGQGLYIWIDYNTDGIKDLNEFELANFAYEANYLRVFVPSNAYVRVFSNQFSSSLDLRPANAWGEGEGVTRFLGKFSDLASFRVDRKTNLDDLTTALDPFASSATDTSLIAYNASARNTLYYDRTSRSWSIDHTWQNDLGRTLLLNGYESRSRLFNTLRIRWNATREWTADVESERGRIANASDLLTGRTYTVEQQALRPRLTWQPNTSFRIITYFKLTEKLNIEESGGEEATVKDLGTEVRYNTAGKGSILATVNLVDIAYTGVINSALGNEMLGGLKPGTNVTWSITVQRNLSRNLQVDLTYNGRRSQDVPVIHVGGAQVRAFF